jgi:hypothetical protein
MALDLQKLAKVCALFRSEFPEERATAAAIADNMVREAGHSWELLFRALTEASTRIADLEARAQTPAWTPTEWREPKTVPQAIEACLEWSAIFTEWELNFLVSISGRSRLSAKQIDVLERLTGKARTAARVQR